MKIGAKSLSTYELVAIIFRFGFRDETAIDLAKKLLSGLEDLSDLRQKTVPELARIRGIGLTKAISLLAAVELGERVLQSPRERIMVASPADVFNLLKYDLMHLEQEVLIALFLDVKTHLVAKRQIFTGSLNQSLIHPREVFKYAVKYSAYALILVHNHPSGDPEPSTHDIEVTKRFEAAGKLLQIEVLDHVIIAGNTYLSIFEYIGRQKTTDKKKG